MFDLRSYPKAAQAWFREGTPYWESTLGAAIAEGMRDRDQLADLLFYLHHPERMRGVFGVALDEGDSDFTALSERWVEFRNIADETLPGGGQPARARRRTVGDGFVERDELKALDDAIERHRDATDDDAEDRALQHITRHIKRVLRCTGDAGSAERRVRDKLDNIDAQEAIDSSRTPLGGYTVALPNWAKKVSRAFSRAGADIAVLAAHKIPVMTDPAEPWKGYHHRRESKESGRDNAKILRQVDVVAFRGHHYTSHLAPGFFTNTSETRPRGFDLRYCLKHDPAGYPDVAFFAASGCATLCRGAQKVLTACFPNAWFFGARTSMTMNSGMKVWPALRKGLMDDATPLLLDNDQDLGFMAYRWNKACLSMLPSEARRVAEKAERRRARRKGRSPRPVSDRQVERSRRALLRSVQYGFVRDEEAIYLDTDGRPSTPLSATSNKNRCVIKEHEARTLPGPEAE